jgi:uncharacterized ion transporter superfamily protein YfcC
MIAYVMRYAQRVKRNPDISPVGDVDLEREASAPYTSEAAAWDLRHAATLTVFVASMVLLVVGVVFIVACARALLVIAEDAKILDTILYAASNWLSVLPRGLIAQVMFLIQCVINFFIHSGTAQAALTMPITSPLADLVGVTRQASVYAYQLCEFINPILPTSAVTMGVLGAATSGSGGPSGSCR